MPLASYGVNRAEGIINSPQVKTGVDLTTLAVPSHVALVREVNRTKHIH